MFEVNTKNSGAPRSLFGLQVSPEAQFHTNDHMYAAYEQIVRDHPRDIEMVEYTVSQNPHLMATVNTWPEGTLRQLALEYRPVGEHLTIIQMQEGLKYHTRFLISPGTISREQVIEGTLYTKTWVMYGQDSEWTVVLDTHPREPLYLARGRIPRTWEQLVKELIKASEALKRNQYNRTTASLCMAIQVFANDVAKVTTSPLLSNEATSILTTIPVSMWGSVFRAGGAEVHSSTRTAALKRILRGLYMAMCHDTAVNKRGMITQYAEYFEAARDPSDDPVPNVNNYVLGQPPKLD